MTRDHQTRLWAAADSDVAEIIPIAPTLDVVEAGAKSEVDI